MVRANAAALGRLCKESAAGELLVRRLGKAALQAAVKREKKTFFLKV